MMLNVNIRNVVLLVIGCNVLVVCVVLLMLCWLCVKNMVVLIIMM